MDITITQAETLGTKAVMLLSLPRLRKESKFYGKAYYETAWGVKTLEGLGRCIFRLVEENQAD